MDYDASNYDGVITAFIVAARQRWGYAAAVSWGTAERCILDACS